MSTAHVSYIKPLKITGPDGSVVYAHGNTIGHYYWAIASEAITQGMGVMLDPTNSIIPRLDYISTDTVPDEVTKVLKSTATTTAGVPFGVALTKAASGGVVLVAGNGSIVAVKVNAAGNVGDYLMGSVAVAAGSLIANAAGTASLIYGNQCKGSITGGSGTQVGILVNTGGDT